MDGLDYPGVYALAISKTDLTDMPFSLSESIAYFGMTKSKGGLRSRLKQFDNTIKGGIGHGGAERFLGKYKSYENLPGQLFVSINYIECNVKSNSWQDLIAIGEVVYFEYFCLAEYVKDNKSLPEFNDMKRSPKRPKELRRIRSKER